MQDVYVSHFPQRATALTLTPHVPFRNFSNDIDGHHETKRALAQIEICDIV